MERNSLIGNWEVGITRDNIELYFVAANDSYQL